MRYDVRNSTEVVNAAIIAARCVPVFPRRIAIYPTISRIVAIPFRIALTRGRLEIDKSNNLRTSLAKELTSAAKKNLVQNCVSARSWLHVRFRIIVTHSSGR